MTVKKRGFLLILIVLFFLGLLTLKRDPQSLVKEKTRFVDQIIVSIFLPVQKSAHFLKMSILHTWNDYFDLVGLKKENLALREDLELKNLYISSLNERLRSQKSFEALDKNLEQMGWMGIPAKVVAYDPFARSQTVWLSEGSDQGIEMDFAVMTTRGLVGRIIKVFPGSAQVLLLVDEKFSVDVIDTETRIRALVTGSGRYAQLKRYPFLTHIEYLQLGDPINPGDALVTSGMSELYPYGIPVGDILKLEQEEGGFDRSAVVLPSVDFSHLEEVIVVKGQKDGKDLPQN